MISSYFKILNNVNFTSIINNGYYQHNNSEMIRINIMTWWMAMSNNN